MVAGIGARDESLALTRDVGADLVIDARLGIDEVVRQIQEATCGLGAGATIALPGAPGASGLAGTAATLPVTMILVQ